MAIKPESRIYSRDELLALIASATSEVMSAQGITEESIVTSYARSAFSRIGHSSTLTTCSVGPVETAIAKLEESNVTSDSYRGMNELVLKILQKTASDMRGGAGLDTSSSPGAEWIPTPRVLATAIDSPAGTAAKAKEDAPSENFVRAWNEIDGLLKKLEPQGENLATRLKIKSHEDAWKEKDLGRLSGKLLNIYDDVAEPLKDSPKHKDKLEQLSDQMDSLRHALQKRPAMDLSESPEAEKPALTVKDAAASIAPPNRKSLGRGDR